MPWEKNEVKKMQNDFMNTFQRFMRNLMQYIGGMNIPQNVPKTPDGIIQYLMDSGRLSQAQYNQAKVAADQLKNSPMFRGLFK